MYLNHIPNPDYTPSKYDLDEMGVIEIIKYHLKNIFKKNRVSFDGRKTLPTFKSMRPYAYGEHEEIDKLIDHNQLRLEIHGFVTVRHKEDQPVLANTETIKNAGLDHEIYKSFINGKNEALESFINKC